MDEMTWRGQRDRTQLLCGRHIRCCVFITLQLVATLACASETGKGASGGAGSNPLAAVSKLDVGWQLKRSESGDIQDLSAKGSFMASSRIKMNYEAHYVMTDVTGDDERDWESVRLKPIFFLKDAQLNDEWGMRLATGFEWIVDFDNRDKGIGSGADQLAPLFGVAFASKQRGLVLIPLIQHFESYDGRDLSQTAVRLIALQTLPGNAWIKPDLKVVSDWENDIIPGDFELEVGKMLNSSLGVFGQLLGGFGGDRTYDWGVGLGVRIMY